MESKKYIIIEADTNDGDYVTSKNLITDEEIELIKPIIEAIKLEDGDYCTQDCGNSGELNYGDLEGYDLFDNLIPHEEHGIHTIVSIEILEVINEYTLL